MQKYLGCASSVGVLCSEPRTKREERGKGPGGSGGERNPGHLGLMSHRRLLVPLGVSDHLVWKLLFHVSEALSTLLMGSQAL